MTRHCPECGALVPLDSAPFCLSCGRGLPSEQATGTTASADPERTVSLPTPPDTERTVRLTAPPDLRQATGSTRRERTRRERTRRERTRSEQ